MEEKPLLQKSLLQEKLAMQRVISPQNGKPIEVISTGKIAYAKLYIHNGYIYASAVGENPANIIGLIKVSNKPDRALVPEDHIKVTKVHFNNAEGKFT